MSKAKYAAFKALDPFFAVVHQGLSEFVDGEHYFDTIADDALFEFLYYFPGWPKTIHENRPFLGRRKLIVPFSAANSAVNSLDNARAAFISGVLATSPLIVG